MIRVFRSLSFAFFLAFPLRAGELSAGAAATDITPPRGCPMAGYYSVRGAEGTHAPLTAKALVLDKDGVKVALVALDLISTTRGLVEDTRALIEKETGIPGENVMISATPSHTGPILWGRTQRDELLGG